MLGIKITGANGLRFMVAGALILSLAGCTGGGNTPQPGGGGSDVPGDNGGTSAPIAPTPTPTVEPDPEGNHEHAEVTADDVAGEKAFVQTFATDLTNRNLTTEQWRAAVTPKLYDETMKELYSTLDPYSVPFCAAVEQVELDSVSTFSATFVVHFKNSTSTLIVDAMDVSANFDGSDYKVLQMNPIMRDDGGC